jgi:hypothetical protein
MSDPFEIQQMLLRSIHSPLENCEQERYQRDQRGQPTEYLPQAERQRLLWCRRTRHPAQTRGAGQLSIFVRYAFTTKRPSATWTPCRRFPQRMKQTASMPQIRHGRRGWRVRSHSLERDRRSNAQPTPLRSSFG